MPVKRRQWHVGHRLTVRGCELDQYGRTEEAEQAFLGAAAHGDFNGMYNLGLLAERSGQHAAARLWYVRAHRAGHPWAANNLGVLLYNADDPMAAVWLRAAVAMGHPQAEANLRLLARSSPPSDVDPLVWPLYLRSRAEAAYRQFTETDNDAALVRSVTLARKAAQAAGDDHPARGLLLDDLRDLLRFRYDLRGRSSDLDEAAAVALTAFEATPPDGATRLDAARSVVSLMRDRFEVTGEVEQLLSALDLGKRALAGAQEDERQRGKLETSLCAALTSLALHSDSGADLDEAVELGRAAVDRLTGGEKVVAATNLGGALQLRGRLRGSPDDLDAAVEVLRSVEHLSVTEAVHQANLAMNLGAALNARAAVTGRSGDEDAARSAEEHARTALRAIPEHNPTTLLRMALAAEDADAIDAAWRAVVALAPTHSARPSLLAHLAGALHKADRTEEALVVAREAAATAVSRHAKLDTRRILARILYAMDDDTAADVFASAAEVCDRTDVGFAEVQVGLAGALFKRDERSPSDADRSAAMAALREAAGAVGSSLSDRLFATQVWSGAAREAGDIRSALEGAREAVSLLRDIGWSHVDQGDRERGLKNGAAMPREAAALAIALGEPELAVELLEQGRALMWRSTLHLRDDFTSVAERAPALAERLEEVRSTMHATPREDSETRARLARQWTRLVDEVRERPGLEDFLTPAPFAELARAADEGPVVIVNISKIRCDALVLRPNRGVEVVPLPGVDVPGMDLVSNTYLEHLGEAASPDASTHVRDRARHTVHDTLEWLWERIAHPVLRHLDLPTASAEPPRVWWCPTASLVPLPLHAAGRYPRTTGDPVEPVGLPYAVVSSYTTTLASLVEARRRRASATAAPLAVGLAETERGHGALPSVVAELDVLRGLFTDGRSTFLVDGEATLEAVRRELPRHAWAHFACHGRLDMVDPSTSGLCLWDDDLNVLHLADLRLDRADLAFLSACHTRLGGGGLPDEAIHTAAALRMAGFRHTIATLWSVHDRAAQRVTRGFYELVREADGLDPTDAATALHRAVAVLRDRYPTNPIVWAPFVHDGP
ncbi:CHAT domain-containing protein [Saccharothrix sp. HUAS TT1]|uniref:CHAT domain-containing protein n=1 Tax=unclassified Saccharothrix TaxID=2593673 RepID=UPI00345B690E